MVRLHVSRYGLSSGRTIRRISDSLLNDPVRGIADDLLRHQDERQRKPG